MFESLRKVLGRQEHLGSVVCRAEHFETAWYRRWAKVFGKDAPPLEHFGPNFGPVFYKVWEAMRFDAQDLPLYRHRKMWEWCAIAQALDERGMLRAGKRGCGFAVGQEPLASLFAARGANVLATDLGQESVSEAWKNTGQHAGSIAALRWPNLVSEKQLAQHVRFQPVDMRDLSPIVERNFDFVWSSCSFEHLGSLEAGLRFVEESAKLLRPGGVAVHTTEINLSSDDRTLESGNTVLYRRSDLRALEGRLWQQFVDLAPLDLDAGEHPFDKDHDIQPWYTTGRHHVKLLIGEFVSSSVLLIYTKQ